MRSSSSSKSNSSFFRTGVSPGVRGTEGPERQDAGHSAGSRLSAVVLGGVKGSVSLQPRPLAGAAGIRRACSATRPDPLTRPAPRLTPSAPLLEMKDLLILGLSPAVPAWRVSALGRDCHLLLPGQAATSYLGLWLGLGSSQKPLCSLSQAASCWFLPHHRREVPPTGLPSLRGRKAQVRPRLRQEDQPCAGLGGYPVPVSPPPPPPRCPSASGHNPGSSQEGTGQCPGPVVQRDCVRRVGTPEPVAGTAFRKHPRASEEKSNSCAPTKGKERLHFIKPSA